LNDQRVRLIAVEAAGLGVNSGESAATSVLGTEGIIHGARTLLMQTEDGQVIEPYSISAGLDYPGIGPLHAFLIDSKRSEAISVTDEDALAAALFTARTEGIIPALETAHAFAALDQMKYGKDDVVVVCLSGRGDKDLDIFTNYLDRVEA
jgi:tryptophan synthase beta chain